jgi:predicted helicase
MRGRRIDLDTSSLRKSLYRPFTRKFCYTDDKFNDCIYKTRVLFPADSVENVAIVVSSKNTQGFSCLAVDSIPSHDFISKGQAYPRYRYLAVEAENSLLDDGLLRQDAISKEAIRQIESQLGLKGLTADQVFSYVYSVLHCEDFRQRFRNSLSKEEPRVPIVKSAVTFHQLVDAGKRLLDLHLNFENVKRHPVQLFARDGSLLDDKPQDNKQFYRVEKMRFAGTRGREDKSTVIYNEHITISNIPLEAYEYVVNGKPALEWVMERQCVKVDKDSGIVNDANDYANETMNNPAYPLELFQRVITVSLETMKIVRSLPKLDL